MTAFKWAVRLRILANLVLAVFMLWAPDKLIAKLGFLNAAAIEPWVQAAGIFYIFITAGYVPSAFAPRKTVTANIFPLIAPILPIILFFWLGGGFLWFALYELIFVIILNVAHRRGFIASLMAKP